MTSDFLKKYEVTYDFLEKYDMYASGFEVQERVRRRRRKRAGTSAAKKKTGNGRGNLRTVFVVAAVCLITVLAGYISAYSDLRSGAGLSYTAEAAEETVYKSIVVESGDTLWGIAGEYSEPSQDIRRQIREICELNGIEPGGIYPGQIIIVPVPAHLA